MKKVLCTFLIMGAGIALWGFFAFSGNSSGTEQDSFTEKDSFTKQDSFTEQPSMELPMPESSMSEPLTGSELPDAENAPAVEISMDQISINEFAPAMDMGRVYPNPGDCVNTVWNEADIIAYYGNNLVPPYIPDGLKEAPHNAAQEVVLSSEGSVWEDTVWLSFYHDYYEDGSPKLTETVSAVKGFYLNASRIGLLNDFCFTAPKNDITVSSIGETAVCIGYRSMEYGPYDPDTHEPSGYYDNYIAQFTLNGIEYELVFSQIAPEEVVRVVASIIYDTDNIVISY